MKQNHLFRSLMMTVLLGALLSGNMEAQTTYVTPALFDTATIEAQLTYLEERTRIYNDFRAIREDMFQKITGNVIDSMGEAKSYIMNQQRGMDDKDARITSLNLDLNSANEDRDDAIRNRDSLSFLGIQMNKALYNTIMWIIVLALAGAAVLLFLLFKRTRSVTVETSRELRNTQQEFEEYRKSSREKYEKLVVSHHNEIMKLKRS